MQTLITSAQMREADTYTIKTEPISSIDLMERASEAFVKVFKKQIKKKETKILILCGQGNNGGDGLAIARLLFNENYKHLSVYVLHLFDKQSDDFKQNLERLKNTKVPVHIVNTSAELQVQADIVIDALLGSGLNKPLEGELEAAAKKINQQNCQVIAVDVPTGLNTEGPIPTPYNGVKADLVISFQRPKLNFFFPESTVAMDDFKVVNIGLDEAFIQHQESNWALTVKQDIQNLIRPRKVFTHKGTYGHALLIAGNLNTMGAALLTAKACVFAGAGLTTLCLPQGGLTALNTSLPEVMALPRTNDLSNANFEKFNVIAIGPGLGTDKENEQLLQQLISLKKALVVDADGLTILSKRKDLLDSLPVDSILTPHMKEFDRLFGEHQNWWQRLENACAQAKSRGLVIVLKNQYTFVCLPTGEIRINPTGNPAMAGGGMGDVLTGIITAFIAQGYSSADAAVLAAYIHGKAGDELAKKHFVVTATQVASRIPLTMRKIKS
jgi:hydroxyethylthiazole kinase-like uncharacterized protein yjeF